MTKSDHGKERRAFWYRCYMAERVKCSADSAIIRANESLAERDKRFPAPEGTSDAR